MSANTTITRIDLVDSVHQQVGLSKADAGRLVSGMLEVITKSLVDGDGPSGILHCSLAIALLELGIGAVAIHQVVVGLDQEYLVILVNGTTVVSC